MILGTAGDPVSRMLFLLIIQVFNTIVDRRDLLELFRPHDHHGIKHRVSSLQETTSLPGI
jgi:hypothetical protein